MTVTNHARIVELQVVIEGFAQNTQTRHSHILPDVVLCVPVLFCSDCRQIDECFIVTSTHRDTVSDVSEPWPNHGGASFGQD